MSFWHSEIGEITGKAEDAFSRIIKIIPDGTTATAKIMKFMLQDDKYVIDWELTAGEFKGQHVFQKIHAFDQDVKRKHKALNMMMYLYQLFQIQPSHSNAPDENDLKLFLNKYAGIKIQEWSMPKNDGSGIMEGNFISEIHNASNFKCETGIKAEIIHNHLESALNRNQKGISKDVLEDDCPF